MCENEKWKTTEKVGNVLYLIRVDIVPQNLLPALKQVEQNGDHVPQALQELELGAAQRNVAEGCGGRESETGVKKEREIRTLYTRLILDPKMLLCGGDKKIRKLLGWMWN